MNEQTILVVDDDIAVRMLLREALLLVPFNVVEASGGVEGLKLARELAPDLVLLDVRMPDLDGIEVLRRLRSEEATRHLPVIFLSGTALEIDSAVSTFDLDPSDVITKNISSKELVARIQWVLRRQTRTLEHQGH